MCVDNNGTIYIADSGAHQIKKVANGRSFFGDIFISYFSRQNFKIQLLLNSPLFIHIFPSLFLSISLSHSFLRYFKGVMSVIAGEGNPGFSDGASGRSKFHYPTGITIDENTGNLYVCDTYNHRIRKITTRGEVFTIAGSSTKGFSEGNLFLRIF